MQVRTSGLVFFGVDNSDVLEATHGQMSQHLASQRPTSDQQNRTAVREYGFKMTVCDLVVYLLALSLGFTIASYHMHIHIDLIFFCRYSPSPIL